MAQQGASGSRTAVDQQEGLLLELDGMDARSVVAEAKARFDASMAKSDALDDSDVTKAAGIVRGKAKMEETRLNGARARLAQASADLSAIFCGKVRSRSADRFWEQLEAAARLR